MRFTFISSNLDIGETYTVDYSAVYYSMNMNVYNGNYTWNATVNASSESRYLINPTTGSGVYCFSATLYASNGTNLSSDTSCRWFYVYVAPPPQISVNINQSNHSSLD